MAGGAARAAFPPPLPPPAGCPFPHRTPGAAVPVPAALAQPRRRSARPPAGAEGRGGAAVERGCPRLLRGCQA